MTETNYRTKLRAVFLAFIMVSSVFAGAMAFAGPGAALTDGTQATPDTTGELDLSTSSVVGQDSEYEDIDVAVETDDDVDGEDIGALSVTLSDADVSNIDSTDDVTVDFHDDDASDTVSVTDVSNADGTVIIEFDTAVTVGNNDEFQVDIGEDSTVVNPDTTGAYDATVGLHTSADESALGTHTLEYTTTDATVVGTIEDSDTTTLNGATASIDGTDYSDEIDTGDSNDYTIEIDDWSALSDTSAVSVTATESGFESASQEVDLAGDNGESTDVDFTLEASDFADYDVDETYDTADDTDGELFWTGQKFAVGGLDENTDVQLREDEGDDVSSLEDELSTDDTGVVVVDTAGIEDGDYYLRNANAGMETSGNPDKTFEISEQALSIGFEDDETDEGDTNELDVDTNRGTSDIVVHANGDLDEGELENIFGEEGDISVRSLDDDEADDLDDDYELDSDQAVVLEGLGDLDPSDEDGTLNLTDIDAAEYDFQFDVSDSDAGDSASLEVTEQDVDAEFTEGVITDVAGDYAEFTVEMEDTDNAYIQFGDEDVGYTDILYIEDDNDDDEVTFWANTRTIGTDSTDVDAYYSEDDIVSSYEQDIGPDSSPTGDFEDVEFLNDDEEALNGDSSASLADFRDALDITELDRPIQPADYELSINGDGGFIVNDDDESESADELDSAVLELEAPTIGEITTHVASSDDADEDDNLDALLDSVTAREEIAIDDRLVIKVEATGLYGALGYVSEQNPDDLMEDGVSGDEFADLVDDATSTGWSDHEGISFEVEAEEAIGNQDPSMLVLDGQESDEVLVLVDEEAGEFYVIVDTDNSDTFTRSLNDGDEYTATLEYETDEDFERSLASPPYDNQPYSVENSEDGYPYFAEDTAQDASAVFSFADQSVVFDNVNVDGALEAENTEASAISGTTNVAPGTDGEIRVSSTDASSSFRSGESVDINEDGEISVEFDFSDQEVDDEFDTTYKIGGTDVDSVSSLLVEAGALSDEDPEDDTSEDDASEDDASEDDESEDDESEDDSTDESEDDSTDDSMDDESEDDSTEDEPEEDTEDDTPGFGALVALVAVLGAALLAARRQN